jgi:hypothetical protein
MGCGMKVRVLIEYDFPESESMTLEDRLAIESEVAMAVPGVFELGDGTAFFSSGFTVEVLE